MQVCRLCLHHPIVHLHEIRKHGTILDEDVLHCRGLIDLAEARYVLAGLQADKARPHHADETMDNNLDLLSNPQSTVDWRMTYTTMLLKYSDYLSQSPEPLQSTHPINQPPAQSSQSLQKGRRGHPSVELFACVSYDQLPLNSCSGNSLLLPNYSCGLKPRALPTRTDLKNNFLCGANSLL